jgi:hypothetical protein
MIGGPERSRFYPSFAVKYSTLSSVMNSYNNIQSRFYCNTCSVTDGSLCNKICQKPTVLVCYIPNETKERFYCYSYSVQLGALRRERII